MNNNQIEIENLKRMFNLIDTWINSIPIEECIIFTRYCKDYSDLDLTDEERELFELKDCPSAYLKEFLSNMSDFQAILPQYLNLLIKQLEEKQNDK